MRKLHFKETRAAVTIMLVVATCSVLIGAVAESAYAQSSAPPTERFVLSGVVFVEDGKGLAWLQEPTFTNNQTVVVRPGDTIGPYRVTKILEDQVVLDGPGGTVSIPLAGGPAGTATAAVDLRTPQVPAPDKPPTVPAIIIPPGDPRRQFPASLILIGAGARITGAVASQASEPQTPEPQAMPSSAAVPNRASTETIAPYVPAHELPPHRGLNNPNMIVIPRGDPRREFPAADFLLGAR
jgi:hypothetical protein